MQRNSTGGRWKLKEEANRMKKEEMAGRGVERGWLG
jgi:hypothetical protein